MQVNSTQFIQLKFITTLWSVDQIAQLLTRNHSRVNSESMKIFESCTKLFLSERLAVLRNKTHPFVGLEWKLKICY